MGIEGEQLLSDRLHFVHRLVVHLGQGNHFRFERFPTDRQARASIAARIRAGFGHLLVHLTILFCIFLRGGVRDFAGSFGLHHLRVAVTQNTFQTANVRIFNIEGFILSGHHAVQHSDLRERKIVNRFDRIALAFAQRQLQTRIAELLIECIHVIQLVLVDRVEIFRAIFGGNLGDRALFCFDQCVQFVNVRTQQHQLRVLDVFIFRKIEFLIRVDDRGDCRLRHARIDISKRNVDRLRLTGMFNGQALSEPLGCQGIIPATGFGPQWILHRQANRIAAHDDKSLRQQKLLIHRNAGRCARSIAHEGGIQLILNHDRAVTAINRLLTLPTEVAADQPKDQSKRNGDPVTPAQGAMNRDK